MATQTPLAVRAGIFVGPLSWWPLTSRAPYTDRGAVRLRHQDPGRQFHLDGAIHGAVGADDIEIDQRRQGAGVFIDEIGRLGGGLVSQWTLPTRDSRMISTYASQSAVPSLALGLSGWRRNQSSHIVMAGP